MQMDKTFKQLPDVKSLLLKGLFAKGSGAQTLPEMSRSLEAIEIDAEHLKAYNKVCGFRDRAVIPPTYLHMMAFPMFMDMLVDKNFPFKIMGAVHVRNSITQHRQIRCSETIDMQCKLQNLQEVNKGFEFDVLATAKVAGELVWESTVTNLVRTKKGDDKGKKKTHEEIDWSVWDCTELVANKDIGRRYAKVSGDYNPIHLYPLSAKLLGFKRAIAHGMWAKAHGLASLDSFFIQQSAYRVDVKFKLPVFLPAKLQLFSKNNGGDMQFWLRDKKTDKPHIEANIVLK